MATGTTDMPGDPETWRLVLARAGRDRPRVVTGTTASPGCDVAAQEAIVDAFAGGSLARGGVGGARRRPRLRGLHAGDAGRRSTRTRGRGMRSASADRPTRRATCASVHRASCEPHEHPGATDEDPVRVAPELGRDVGCEACSRARSGPTSKRLALSARRPPSRPARARTRWRRYPRVRRGRPVHRRGRRGRVGARAAPGPPGLAGRDHRGRSVLAPRRGLGL